MPGHPNGRPKIGQLVAALLLLTLILAEVAANPAYSSGSSTSSIAASPGKFDLPLGNDFPTFGSVKLSYPDSAILTNSTGDLLFSVALNPLMLNPSSGQVLAQVLVQGSGFSSSDSSCLLSGNPVASPTCSISGGSLTGSFVIGNVPAGSYTITATGNQEDDYSSASFTVLPPSLVLNPSSGPDGATVSFSGVGFYSTDSSCVLTGSPAATLPSCSIAGGVLTPGSFVVASTAPTGAYTITATTNGGTGGDTGEATTFFAVTTTSPSQQITLSSSIAQPGTKISVTSSLGFSLIDAVCSLSGIPVGIPNSCTIVAGTITASFLVANVQPGTYTITATGCIGPLPCGLGSDMATYNFQVQPAAPSPSAPITTAVSLSIYIPPDFSGLTTSNLWTSFTNNYDPHIVQLSRQSASDQIGPNWWEVSVSVSVTNNPSYVNPENQTFLTPARTQYIRLFKVTSPTTAGRYFFKVFINGVSVGAQNFPTIVIKASRDPAYISGVLRDSGYRNVSRAGEPITLPNGTGAQVLATGIDYLGRPVSAQTFINSTADGNYTLFGVAPGTYNITAYAAGYEPATRPWTVTVAAAQSLEDVDVYLTESVNITGTVLSESAEGNLIPWGTLTGFGPPPPGCRSVYPTATMAAECRAITIEVLNACENVCAKGIVGTLAASTPAPYSILTYTTPTSTEFNFAIQDEVGFDGRIPQNYANYTSGLVFGDYLLQAYVTSYIQLEQDEILVHVDNETTSTFSTIPLIRTGQFNVTVHFKNSAMGTLVDSQMNACFPTCTLTVSAYDTQGILRAQNTTSVPFGATSWNIALQGLSSARGLGLSYLFPSNYGILPGTYYITASVTSSPSFSGYANLGIATLYFQTSNVLATIGLGEGTVDISFPLYKAGGVLLDLCSINYQLPPHFQPWGFPGTSINFYWGVSLPKVTWGPANSTQPVGTACRPVTFLGFQTGSYDLFVQTLGYTQRQILHLNVVLGWNTDAATWLIENPVINLTIPFRDEGLLTSIDSTLPFAEPINNLTATPARVEVFDDLGNFVAANATYVPNGSSTANFTLAGFNQYFGDPRLVWSGFYDTTDGAKQNPDGLFLYPWNLSPRTFTIRIWIDGYYQLQPLRITIAPPQNVSVVAFMDRASRISGAVLGPDYFNIARHLSWATITLQPNNDTLTTIIDIEPEYYTTSSLDGSFQVWVPQGTYGMGVSLEGYATYSAQVVVPAGSDMNMQIWLDNYQPPGQLGSTATSIAANSALSIKPHVQRVPKPWVGRD